MLHRGESDFFRGTCPYCEGVVTEILHLGLDEDENGRPPRVSRCSSDGAGVVLELVRCEAPGCIAWANEVGSGESLVCSTHTG